MGPRALNFCLLSKKWIGVLVYILLIRPIDQSRCSLDVVYIKTLFITLRIIHQTLKSLIKPSGCHTEVFHLGMSESWSFMHYLNSKTSYYQVWYPYRIVWIDGWLSFLDSRMPPLLAPGICIISGGHALIQASNIEHSYSNNNSRDQNHNEGTCACDLHGITQRGISVFG